ncbi:hypothetical protein TanjilG_14866 [Lupinus angustifolius]|uniref:J domain-containing protein n=1 Tax=Lupinus angustifolius TaxID=3871 RepID=A0A1J7G6P3_LUPAN|nr:PREDICTED: uncharacterized protein LOC109329562 [Lupinus angustifolius]OIV96189.1 hypothetical protein TanjilG_14866 [Lupinus angustifolius]
MDAQGSGGGGRAEAERWLFTANKLLTARDLHGARSFAIRARESDPRYEATELLLVVIDTLLAGEVRIGEHLLDWYSILQVLRYTHSIEYIAAQYRRLAILLDPNRNPFAFTNHALQLVHDAWSVLSNPNKKIIYDNDLRLLTEPPQQRPPPPPVVTGFQFPPPRQNQDQNQHQLNQNQTPVYQSQQQQQQQQQQVPIRKNPKPSNQARVVVVEEERHNETEPEPVQVNQTGDATLTRSETVPVTETENEVPSFWTACPYCYVMYEYPKVYEDCTLRCQSCRRGFTALVVKAPPNLGMNDDGYCSWGFIPVGFSGNSKDLSGGSSEWNPFSPLFPCPLKGRRGRKGPVAYYDQEACTAFVEKELSDSSDDSDDGDWRNTYTKKLRKRARGSGRRTGIASASGVVRRSAVDRPRRGVQNSAEDGNVANGEAVNGDGGGGSAPAVPVAARPDTSKKTVLVGARRRAAGNLGKLDLNVEFSNEVEEHAPGVSGRNGRNASGNATGTGHAEDNIEGIGFFEGLDEFLSSLPILNVVADDKVKGH